MEHTDVDTAQPSVTITPELQRAMVRDLTRHLCGLWYMVVAWIASGVVALLMLALSMFTGDAVLYALTVALVVAVASMAWIYGDVSRRTVGLAYPQGTVTTAVVSHDSLATANAVLKGEAKFITFTGVRETTTSVILPLRGAGGTAVVLPREAFTDLDLARLRAGVSEVDRAKRN